MTKEALEPKMAGRLRPMWFMATRAFRVAPKYSALSFVLFVVGSITPLVFAVFVGQLVQAVIGGASAERVAVIALGLTLTCGIGTLVREIAWKIVQVVEERTNHAIDREILEVITRTPGIEHYENSEYLDKVEQLRGEHWLLGQSVSVIFATTTLLVQFVSIVLLFASIDPWLLLMPLLGIPQLIAARRAERRRVTGMERLRGQWRRSDDAVDFIVQAGSAKEVRVFGLDEEILARHKRSSRLSFEQEFGDRLAGAWWIAAGRMLFVAGFAGALWLVANRAINGEADISSLVIVAGLAGTFMGQLHAAAQQVAWLDWTLTAVRRYVWILDYENQRRPAHGLESPSRVRKSIRFDHVSFTYPGTDRVVLEDIDVDIPAGATVALIGDNGAGKTTLIKLLTRMYEPTSGNIFIDDVALSDIDPVSWRNQISAAFQDHARLELVTAETVGVGDLDKLSDRDHIGMAVERGAATDVIHRLTHGLDTQLGAQWEDGVDLSGGQWQKLALARGMMRDPLLLVLDEPTSALDAETEHALFERFASAAQSRSKKEGTITVLVSHRFSTVRMADLILVISGGKIVEQGSHEALMAADGLYAELYNLQARAYQ